MSARLRRTLAWAALWHALGFAASAGAQTPHTGPPPTEVELAVYATALRFYDPPRDQLRWIESAMIGDAEDAGLLEPVLLSALLERLGDDFHPWVEGGRGSGGRLRVSALRAAAPDTFRVTVRYQHRSPYFEGSPFDQVFLVARAGDRWRILARGEGSVVESP